MDDQSWDDYLRETPGTTFGDEARRARERSQGKIEQMIYGGIRAGGSKSTAQEWEPSETSAKIFLALLFSLAIIYAAVVQLDLQWGWKFFLGVWAGLSIVQFVWPIMFKVMGWVLSAAILGGIAYFIYAVVTA